MSRAGSLTETQEGRGPGPGRGRRDQGFSLLEVLVATTLVGLVLVVLLQVMTSGLRAQAAVRGQARALQVAEKVLGEYSTAKNLTEGSYQGQEGKFAYRLVLTPQYEVKEAGVGKLLRIYHLQVTVSWPEAGRTKALNLQTMRTVVQKRS